MPAQKREVKRNYIGLVSDESEQQCAAQARPESGRPAKDYIGRLDLRLRKEDRVEVVANSGGNDPAEHATLVVTEADKHGHAKVALLHLYKRDD